ncbi:hypothetical protein GC176_01875 [bacterium]|nr:hypothetical protein [bacterium]
MAGRQPQDAQAEAPLVPKLIRWPADWVERIDAVRGEQSFSDFVRDAVHAVIDDGQLSGSPQWGQGRPPKLVEPDEVIEEIRRVTEHELNRHARKKRPA